MAERRVPNKPYTPPGQKDLRYPRRGLAILPSVLYPLFAERIRHPTLSDGVRATPIKELGAHAWHSMRTEDCQRVATGLISRLNHFWAEPQKLKQMASIAIPIHGATDLASLEMSAILRETLAANNLDARKLSEMSLFDFWNLKNVGSRRLLELLALLEIGHAPESKESVTSSPTEATLVLIDRIAKRIGDIDVGANDVRFGAWISSLHPNHLSLKKSLAALRTGARVTSKDPWPMLNECLHAIDRKLGQLHTGTLEDDLYDILLTICRGNERKTKIVSMRLGWSDGNQRTLQEVGDLVGLTRERVRQMESRAQKLLERKSVYSPKLTDALQIAKRMTPCRSDTFARELVDRGFLRTAWPASTFVIAAVYLGLPHGLNVFNAGAGELLAGEIATSELAQRVRGISREIAQRQGAANVKDVAFRASEGLQRWVSYREAHAVVGSLSDVEWLDEANGWFWCGEPAKSRVIGTIRKMLSVSPRIAMDEIYEGLIRNSRMDDEGFAPKPIIQMVCARIPWMQVHQRAYLKRRESFSWRDELVGVERVLVEVLVEAGNALDHYDFKRRSMARSIPEGSFTVYEGNSPVIQRISPGIWGLRGATISPRLLVELNDKINARNRVAARARLEKLPPGTVSDDSQLCLFNITASVFKNHCMTLATSVSAEAGTHFEVRIDSRRLGTVLLTEDRRLRGLLPLLRNAGALPGQIYTARFDLQSKLIQMDRAKEHCLTSQ